MNYYKFVLLPCILAVIFSHYSWESDMKAQQIKKERIIEEYFDGWEKKNWNIIANLLADEFTFTSPNNDDPIPAAKFYEKCWVQAAYIQKFHVIKIIGNGNKAFVMYECYTKNNGSFRNTEYFTFTNGKIKEIEVFFGAGQGFPSNKK